ncbi:MAG: glycosyltransferase family 2 protein [Aeromicrobium sp.]|nr:MAG: glycosyltransferase family 2 protein [Aeromicrobium sp.]
MPYSLDQVLIVMPAKNEEAVVGNTVAEVKNVLPEATVLVISDGSTDRTAERARTAGADVLELPINLGVGGAMRLGFRYAHLHGFPVMVQLDSDGQHNPANVPGLVNLLDAANVAIGARFAGVGEYKVRGPRMWAMRALSTTLSLATGTRLTDTTSGFKAHDSTAISLYKDDFPAEYLGDTIEALVIGHRGGLKFTQLAVEMRERAGGVPSQNAWKSTKYLGRAFAALGLALIRPGAKNSR